LGADFGVNEKTIRTDIHYLRSAESLPIDEIRERGGWGFTEEVKAFDGDEFTRGEYLALWLSVQSLEAWGGLPQQKKMPSLMRKLKATAAEMDPDQLNRMRRYVTFKAGGFQAPVEQGVFDTVMRALLRREELAFGYVSLTRQREQIQLHEGNSAAGTDGQLVLPGAAAPALRAALRAGDVAPLHSTSNAQVGASKGKTARAAFDPSASVLSWAAGAGVTPEPRRVQPLHLLCWEYAWYLFAWDYERNDIRTFALGRMSGAEATGVPFEPAVKFDLRKELSKSFGITRGKKAVRVHLRFQPRAIPLVIERLWLPSQCMIENEDGTLDLTMDVAVTPELTRWVQSWGADCAVLAPESLDDEVLKEARKKLEEAARRRGIKFVVGG
jgi:predicted DNA-binding transcriptional regulator YafY